MLSIQDILNEITSISTSTVTPTTLSMNIIFVVDNSGSTGTPFVPSMTVLEKELSVVYEYILAHPQNNYSMYSFESRCINHGPISVLHDEGLVTLPNLHPAGGTNTHGPFVEINNKVGSNIPNIVILVTDGETNSPQHILQQQMGLFTSKNIKLEIIAVSAKNLDLSTITRAEESRIPGMDIINYLSNSVEKLTIYNQFHKDTPYEGSTSSTVDKACLTFMGFKVVGHAHAYINTLIAQLEAHRESIRWGTAHMDFKKMVVEIGKLLTVYFVSLPIAQYVINFDTAVNTYAGTEHFFVDRIIADMCAILGVADMTPERIYKLIKYGFDSTKTHTPFMFTNLDEHVKEHSVKQAEFKSAIETLKQKGTTLGSTKTICLPINGVCIINNQCIELTEKFSAYVNSRDRFQNVYFGCDDNVDGQATRIALRELCAMLGFRDSKGPAPVFYVLSEMMLMHIKGVQLDSDHMKELRKLAIIQTSMESMIARDKYDGVGLYRQWNEGRTFAINYAAPTVFHSSLYMESKINQLQLDEPLWWATMMCMLGLFEEQKHNYLSALTAKGISTQEEFLVWLRTTYADTVKGNINLHTAHSLPISVFTLDHFVATDEVFELVRHGPCNTHTLYSRSEIESYVMPTGCVWCRHRPSWAEFVRVHIDTTNHIEQIDTLIRTSERLYVPFEGASSGLVGGAGAGSSVSSSVSSRVSSRTSPFVNAKNILINMIGITGAGKSTSSKKIYDLITGNHGACLIVSADKWSKRGKRGKQLQRVINAEITAFDRTPAEYKVIIIDICNENGPSSNCFGFNTSGYTTFNFYPNLDKTQFSLYEYWCLRNVLMRPNCTEADNYWLNPESAGVGTCIKVHTIKSTALKRLFGISNDLLFSESMSMDAVMTRLATSATAYETYLATQNLDDIIVRFIKSTGFPL